ncbi:MAG: winged helix DNA-binding protein [Candidatus Aenigmatarchaeota archaeon]
MGLNETELTKLFLRSKPVKMIISLKKGPKYATQVSKEIDCTYSHTVKLLDELETLGLVTFKKHGRIKVVELTEDGVDLAHSIEGVLIKLSRIKEGKEKEE